MGSFVLLLRLAAPILFVVALLHLALGARADVLLGARLPPEALADAVLDSQNRFYGVAFAVFGVLMLLASTDVRKYAPVLRCVLWVFFAAGLARLVSMASHGAPSPAVVALLLSELLVPPLLIAWLHQLTRDDPW